MFVEPGSLPSVLKEDFLKDKHSFMRKLEIIDGDVLVGVTNMCLSYGKVRVKDFILALEEWQHWRLNGWNQSLPVCPNHIKNQRVWSLAAHYTNGLNNHEHFLTFDEMREKLGCRPWATGLILEIDEVEEREGWVTYTVRSPENGKFYGQHRRPGKVEPCQVHLNALPWLIVEEEKEKRNENETKQTVVAPITGNLFSQSLDVGNGSTDMHESSAANHHPS